MVVQIICNKGYFKTDKRGEELVNEKVKKYGFGNFIMKTNGHSIRAYSQGDKQYFYRLYGDRIRKEDGINKKYNTIHHKDGDKLNETWKNYGFVTGQEHGKIHTLANLIAESKNDVKAIKLVHDLIENIEDDRRDEIGAMTYKLRDAMYKKTIDVTGVYEKDKKQKTLFVEERIREKHESMPIKDMVLKATQKGGLTFLD